MKRAPYGKPTFTLGQLKKAIPPHCFKRSLLISSSYLALDLIIATSLFYMVRNGFPVDGHISPSVLWVLYWIAQGCILTGIWVIAHECGHHAFSDYALVDNIVGLVLHSFLLVPYFSWKYSHSRHHSNTGSINKDEVFVPKTKERLGYMRRLSDKPLGRIAAIFVTLTLGWPFYLLFNASGRDYERSASHFDPNAPIFNDRERPQVLISNVSLCGVALLLCKLAYMNGIAWLIKVYIVPLFIVNAFLVLITFLQHTHVALPHYSDDEWEWLRGALSTVDRDYGILNHIFHHITDTHVAHHVFSTMPHYNAGEATKALKPILGSYYQFDSTPVIEALWREFKECVLVKPDNHKKESGIFWYTNKLN